MSTAARYEPRLDVDIGQFRIQGNRHRDELIRVALRLGALFRLPAPDAPTLCFLGGRAEADAIGPAGRGVLAGNIAGAGLDWSRAFETCVGEAAEFWGQVGAAHLPTRVQAAGGVLEGAAPALRRFLAGVLEASGVGRAAAVACTEARRMSDGAVVAVPVDLCVRRAPGERDFTPPLKLGTGCGAGATAEAAALHGLLELIERDAVALWWRGGTPARALPAGSTVVRGAAALLHWLRAGNGERRTWLLDVTSDLGVPVVVALSARAGGRGLAYGAACRPHIADAAAAALIELCQMELGQHLAQAKLMAGGAATLTAGDRLHLHRAEMLDPACCTLLHPTLGETVFWEAPETDDAGELLRCLVALLERRGIETYAVALTRSELDIPVVRVIAPGLQLDPCELVSPRLARAIVASGGGARLTRGIRLF
ncbi:MAG TPA: YcaO-like family protein [Acetobacteraceae bacterium]|nr:YcaO-like family protein [Acetobacteraceae bacterium]